MRVLARLRHLRIRELSLAWVLPALVFRAMVPAGFMLGAGADGTLTVELCTATGYQTVVVHYGDQGQPDDPPSHGTSHADCPFAASALLAPAPTIATAAAGFSVDPSPLPALRVESLPDERDRRPGARAPPVIA